jgi:hypothetical protein
VDVTVCPSGAVPSAAATLTIGDAPAATSSVVVT